MTLALPDGTKRARIVVPIVGPVTSLQLRHVPSDWHVVTTGRGIDLEKTVEQLRRAAVRSGYVVDGASFHRVIIAHWPAFCADEPGQWRRASQEI